MVKMVVTDQYQVGFLNFIRRDRADGISRILGPGIKENDLAVPPPVTVAGDTVAVQDRLDIAPQIPRPPAQAQSGNPSGELDHVPRLGQGARP